MAKIVNGDIIADLLPSVGNFRQWHSNFVEDIGKNLVALF